MTQNPDSHQTQRRYLISGRVQRVGFRYATYRAASAIGLQGYVRNLADGQVEICAEGSSAALEKLRQWLRKGPMLARVEAVHESPCQEQLGRGFRIR